MLTQPQQESQDNGKMELSLDTVRSASRCRTNVFYSNCDLFGGSLVVVAVLDNVMTAQIPLCPHLSPGYCLSLMWPGSFTRRFFLLRNVKQQISYKFTRCMYSHNNILKVSMQRNFTQRFSNLSIKIT